MKNFKVNYDQLKNISHFQLKYINIIFLLIMLIIIWCLFRINVYKTHKVYGVFSNNLLHVKINTKLSDKIKSCNIITFNNKKSKFNIKEFLEYEIINNEIYQEITINTDIQFKNNEIGEVIFHLKKQKLIYYILDLFK